MWKMRLQLDGTLENLMEMSAEGESGSGRSVNLSGKRTVQYISSGCSCVLLLFCIGFSGPKILFGLFLCSFMVFMALVIYEGNCEGKKWNLLQR